MHLDVAWGLKISHRLTHLKLVGIDSLSNPTRNARFGLGTRYPCKNLALHFSLTVMK